MLSAAEQSFKKQRAKEDWSKRGIFSIQALHIEAIMEMS